MISDGSADLRVASAAEEATQDAVPQGNESLPSRTAVVSESISAGSAASTTRPESAVSEDGPLTTAGPESKEDVSSETRHTDESVPKTALELNEHLLDEAHPLRVRNSSMVSSKVGAPGTMSRTAFSFTKPA